MQRVGLIDVDGHNFPNLPLMKISAYHKARGDSVEWYEPLFSRVWIKDKAEKAIKANGSRAKKLQAFIKTEKQQLEREEKEASDE
jgi:hypothetical protein